MKPVFLRIELVAIVLFAAHIAFGASIREREKNVTERSSAKAEKKSKSRASNDIASSTFGSGTYPSSDGGASFL